MAEGIEPRPYSAAGGSSVAEQPAEVDAATYAYVEERIGDALHRVRELIEAESNVAHRRWQQQQQQLDDFEKAIAVLSTAIGAPDEEKTVKVVIAI